MKATVQVVRRDALGEAGNIGAGCAAAAMERLLGETGMMSPPRVGSGARPIGAVEASLPLHSPVVGEILVVFGSRAVGKVLRAMDPGGRKDLLDLGAREISCLCEAANILACAYLSALAELTRFTFLPSPPVLRMGGRCDPNGTGRWVASSLRIAPDFELQLVLAIDRHGEDRILEALGGCG